MARCRRRANGMGMRRGDLATVDLPGNYGKPRPALILQSDLFDSHPSVTILPVTGDLREAPLFRINIHPNDENGLRKASRVMVDKAQSIPRAKIGETFRRLGGSELLEVNRALAVFLGFA